MAKTFYIIDDHEMLRVGTRGWIMAHSNWICLGDSGTHEQAFNDFMELKISSAIGTMDETIDISLEGKTLLIGFNPRFLIDALRVIDEEEIDIYLMNPKAPCVIRDKEESYIYLILPVNFVA